MSRKLKQFSLRETQGFSSNKVNSASTHEAFARKLAAKAVIILVFFLIVLAVLYGTKASGLLDPTKVKDTLNSAGNAGPFIVIGLLIFTSMSLAVPSSPFIILAGALYGSTKATLYCTIGILIGASIAFWISRIFREPIINMLGEHAQVLVKFQKKYVMSALFITRAIPAFSFEIMSYAAGLTSISYPQYLLATLGVLASVFILATIGKAGAAIAFSDGSNIYSIIFALLLTAMLFVIPLAIDHYNPWGWKDKLLKK